MSSAPPASPCPPHKRGIKGEESTLYGFIDWAKALSEGIITPRNSIKDKEEDHTFPFSKDIVIKAKMGFMPVILFPHSTHNFWLSCNICHPNIFEAKAWATPISMVGIWKGEFCGRCHDRVAFPLRNCFRCHSVKRETRR
jgi:c(7)-type cytochrome triheme protein